MRTSTLRPNPGGRTRHTAELMLGTALGGALIVLAGASPAAADDECGAPVSGVVTCTVAGGPFNAGVVYGATTDFRLTADAALTVDGGLSITSTRSLIVGAGNDLAPDPLISVTQQPDATAVSLDSGTFMHVRLGDVAASGALGAGIDAHAVGEINLGVRDVLAGESGIRAVSDLDRAVIVARNVTLASDAGVGAGVHVEAEAVSVTVSGAVRTTGEGLAGIEIEAASDASVAVGVIETHGDNAVGLDVAGDEITIVNTSVSTHGSGSHGIRAASAGGPVSITTDAVTTRGDGATAIDAGAEVGGAVSIVAGAVSTEGYESIGISVWQDGSPDPEMSPDPITVDVDSVSTKGDRAKGIDIRTFGDATVTAGTVTTGQRDSEGVRSGDDADGVAVLTDGDATIIAQSVTTYGDYAGAVSARSADEDVVIDVGTVVTYGDDAPAVYAYTNAGRIDIDADSVDTWGENSVGVLAETDTGSMDIDLGDVTTQGEAAAGVSMRATSPDGAQIALSAQNIRTEGDHSIGVYVENAGTNEIALNSLITSGRGATGLYGHLGTYDVTVTGPISTQGDDAFGVLIENADDGAADAPDVRLNLGAVSTWGENADGVRIDQEPETSDPVSVEITVGAITTGRVVDGVSSGSHADGVQVRNGGLTRINAASITTHGNAAQGVRINGALTGRAEVTVAGPIATAGTGVGISQVESADVRLGDVTTTGLNSTAVVVSAHADPDLPVGLVSVRTGDVTAQGENAGGLTLTSRGEVYVETGDIETAGPTSTALEVFGGAGRIEVHTGDIATANTASDGVSISGNGDVVVTTGAIDVDGGNSRGVDVFAYGDGDVTLNIGAVSTLRQASTGVSVGMGNGEPGSGGVLQMAVQSILTEGRDSHGLSFANGRASTVVVGDIETRGFRSSAVLADGMQAGDITLTTGDILTLGDESAGVGVRRADTVSVETNHIVTRGLAAKGVFIAADPSDPTVAIGDVVVRADSVTTESLGAGAIGIHVDARTRKAGADITVVSGPVETFGAADGVYIQTNDAEGLTTLHIGGVTTRADNARGVVFEGGGELEIVVDNLDTSGDGAVGVDVRGGAGAIDVTVARGETTGAGAHGVSVIGQGEVDVAVGALSAGGDGAHAVGAEGRNVGLTLHGALSGQASAATLNAVERADVDIRAGGEVVGEDVGLLITSGTGTFITNRGSITSMGYAIDTVGGSTSIANEGQIFGRVHLTDNGDSIANSGEFHASGVSDFGGETDVFNNTGLLTVSSRPGAPGTASFINLERFNNAGTIDLADGVAGDQLTLGDTVLHGLAGSRILMDLDLRGATPAADLLTVGALEGVSAVELHVQGRGAVGDTGVTLIASGAAQTGNEVTVTTVGGGFLRFDAVYDAASREFRVVAEAARQAFEPTRIASGAQTQWRRGADVVSARFDELRDSGAMGLRRGERAQVWAQGFAGSDEVDGERRFSPDGTESVDLTHDVDARGAQFGVDIVRGLGGGDLVLGLAAGVGETELTFQSNGDTAEFSGGGVGAYAHWSSGPLAIGVQAKADRYDLDYRFVSADLRDSAEGETIGARVDVSWRMPATGDWLFESQGSLAWTDTDLGGIEGEAGEVEFGDTRSVLARAGVRLARAVRLDSGAVVQPFVGVHRLHELDGENASRIHLNDDVLEVTDPGRGTWTQFTAGANVGVGAVQGFAQGEATLGDVRGYTARVGVRLNW